MTKFSVTTKKLCREIFFFRIEQTLSNRENSIATKFSVAIEKLCRNKENFVTTKMLEKSEKPKNCSVGLFSGPFHPRTINTNFFRFLGQREGGRTPLMGFLSLNCPFFQFFCKF